MAGLFLSHASADKQFVYRLATDLVDRGMPVWFDTWEIDTGDSLHSKIYDSLGASEYVILVMSPRSVVSTWVDKELTAALNLEERHGRTVVLPIRLESCEVPLAIADRIYADFSGSYFDPFERLVARLTKLGLHDLDEPPEHALVPLSFEKGLYLDGVRLQERIASLRPRLPDGFEFQADQFVLVPDDRYVALRDRMVERRENIEDDPYYTPDFSRGFRQRYNSMLDLERQLIEGVQMIVNGYIATDNPAFDLGIACHWLARAIRSETLGLLWSSQNPDLPELSDFGRDVDALPFSDNVSAARFLEVDEVCYVDVGPRQEGAPGPFARLADSVAVPIAADSVAARYVADALVCAVHSVGDWELYSKYLVPYLVRRHVGSPASPCTLTFDDWYIGVH